MSKEIELAPEIPNYASLKTNHFDLSMHNHLNSGALALIPGEW
jgi:hypothetical protein